MLCAALPAQATNFDVGPSISAKAEYPAMLTGLPKENFYIILKIYNPFKIAEGSISFETGQANHGDTDGVFIKTCISRTKKKIS